MSDHELLHIAEEMAFRLRVWKRLRHNIEEQGSVEITLETAELFEQADAIALDAFDNYLLIRSGERPLSPEIL